MGPTQGQAPSSFWLPGSHSKDPRGARGAEGHSKGSAVGTAATEELGVGADWEGPQEEVVPAQGTGQKAQSQQDRPCSMEGLRSWGSRGICGLDTRKAL